MRNSSDSPNKPPVDHTGSYDYAEDKENRTLGAANIPSALASEVPRTELQVKPASYSYPKPGNNIPAKLLHLLNPIIETTEEASMGWAAINGHEQDLFGSDGLSEPEEWQLDDDSSLLGGSDSDLSSWSNVDNGSLFSDDDEVGRRKRRKRGRPPLSSETVGKLLDLRADLSNLPSFQRLPFRKQYLNAGLYAGDCTAHKLIGGDRSARLSARRNSQTQPAGNTSAVRPPPILPLPSHFGEWLLAEERDFMLPYEIIYQHQNKLFEVDREPPQYIKIRSNIFVERKRRFAPGPVCECQPQRNGEEGCGEDCINRCTFYECNVKTCPNGESCTNRRFQLKKTLADKLKVFTSGDKRGFGLRTLVPIKKGDLVIEYVGEVISQETCINRLETDYAKAHCFYFLDYGNGEVLDGTVKGNDARFVNHSCDPNCYIEKWHLDGEFAVGLFASRDIREGEELTYDYNFHTHGEQVQVCLCGSENCRGLMGKSSEYRDGDNVVMHNAKKRGPAPILGRRRRQLLLQFRHYQRNSDYYTDIQVFLLRNIYLMAASTGAKIPTRRRTAKRSMEAVVAQLLS